MSAATGAETVRDGRRVPWGDVLMSAVAAVSWALIGMAGTAALGLRLLEADAAGSLGPMTAAVVALGAGGSVTPSGDVSAFGLTGAEADTAIEIAPLGVSLVGAVLLAFFFLRSLRAAGVVISPAELAARAGAVVALFVAMLGGLAWAGHDVITIDGGSLGLDDVTGGSGGVEVPGLGDIGGLLPDRLGDLVDARAAVGFTVDTAPTLLGGLGWSTGVLVIALLASRRTPLPPGWEAVHRVVRPAVSAVVTVLSVAVAAGFAAAAYAAVGDDHPRRIAGAALLGAPNGVWLGIPIGLLVPWDGHATGELTRLLPDPLDDLLGAGGDRPVTLGRLAELDGRVWLLGVAAASMMLLAGVLTGVRTPVVEEPGGVRFAGRCALRLGTATAFSLPLLAWLTDVSVTASLSVLGFDAFGAGLALHGHLATAFLLGAVWGAGAGAAGAGLARACGAAGRHATAMARGAGGGAGGAGLGTGAWRGVPGQPHRGEAAEGAWQGEGAGRRWPGPGDAVQRPGDNAASGQAQAWSEGSGSAGHGHGAGQGRPGPGNVMQQPGDNTPSGQTRAWSDGSGPTRHGQGTERGWPGPGNLVQPPGDNTPGQAQAWSDGSGPAGHGQGAGSKRPGQGEAAGGGADAGAGRASRGEGAGPYTPGTPYRPPDPGTNPYLRVPEDAGTAAEPRPAAPPDDGPPAPRDLYAAPTVIRPIKPPPRGPRQGPGPGNGNRPPARPDDGPPPPPPPPSPPRKPRGGR
ncbi:streptophobe family protein [Streptomyces sp. NPDC050698]